MNQSQWQKLDPAQLPESAAIYAVLWRRKWLHLGSSDNLKQTLSGQPWPYRIALSLSDAELLWMKTDDPRRQEAKLKRMLRCQWQCLGEGLAAPEVQSVSKKKSNKAEVYPSCNWPSAHNLAPAIPMVARPLANTSPLTALV